MQKPLAIALAFLTVILASIGAQAKQRPNIVLFLVDDMGWMDTSVPFHSEKTELNERYRTPSMEELAARGKVFTNAYAHAICSPTRISLMTGTSPARHGVTNWTLRKNASNDAHHSVLDAPKWNVNGLSPIPGVERTYHARALPSYLSQAGYKTIHVGKAHFGAIGTPAEDPLAIGFDVNIAGHAAGGLGSFYGQHNFSAVGRDNNPNANRVWDVPGLDKYHGQDINLTEALTREALEQIDLAAKTDQPFFLYMSHYTVHVPVQADNRFIDNYEELDRATAAYATMVEGMDHSLGDIMRRLETLGIDDNTVILFMSDNGGLCHPSRGGPNDNQNTPLAAGKGSAREGGIRVPMIVAWPGVVEPGSRTDTPVIIEDYFPTLLSIAGADEAQTPAAADSMSFVDVLQDKPADRSDRAFVWHVPNFWTGRNNNGYGPTSTIRLGDWKLTYHHNPRVQQRFELFNLADDLSETNNLADQRPDQLVNLANQLQETLMKRGAQMPTIRETGQPVPWPADALPVSVKQAHTPTSKQQPEALADRWQFLGQAINEPDFDVWGSSPIMDEDGRVHLFSARWPESTPFEMGWRTDSHIARYVGDSPEGPFAFAEVVAAGDGEGWDAQGFHNPNIQRINGRYVLTYIANPKSWTDRKDHPPTQRIGMLVADSLEGPWEPANGDADTPMLAPPDDPGIWCHNSRVGVNNPALLAHPDDRFFLYFKAAPGKHGHVQMGVAIADQLEGPYVIQPKPITANDQGIEDGYAFTWRDHICLITTDNHGILDEGGGLLWVSRDGLQFEGQPLAGFHHFGRHYFPDGVPNTQRQHYGLSIKFERPQILMIDSEPGYLYVPCGNAVDGSDGTNCYVLKYQPDPNNAADKTEPGEDTLNLKARIPKLTNNHLHRTEGWHNWGASILQSENGRWHMFYARWPEHGGSEYGFSDWLWTSEIAHAVSDSLDGPWKIVGTVLENQRLGQWDALTAHNPRIREIDGKFYLYYISHGKFDALPKPEGRIRNQANWKIARNSQFSGVAVADKLEGPYVRRDKPLLVGDGPLINLAVNPTLIARPDGTYQLVVKGDNPKGGHRIYGQALSDSPTGPFEWQEQVIATGFNTEDPDAWYDEQRNRYYALVTRAGNPKGDALALITSENGLDWTLSKHSSVLGHKIQLAQGDPIHGHRIERPSIIRDQQGNVVGLTTTILRAHNRDWKTSTTVIIPFK